MALPVTITGISTAVPCLGPFKTSNNRLYTTEETQITASVLENFGNAAATLRRGQVFTTGGSPYALYSITIDLSKSGTPADNLQINVWAVDGGSLPTGAALGTSDNISGSSLSGTRASYEFVFSTPIELAAGTSYAWSVNRTSSVDASNFYRVYKASGAPSGIGLVFDNSGAGVWSEDVGNKYGYILKSIAYQEAFYFIGVDSGSVITFRLYKATDPTSSWASVDFISSAVTSINAMAACQVGDIIHVAFIDGATTSCNLKYFQADLSIDDVTTLSETIHSSFNPQTNASANVYGCSICMQNSQPTILYNGPQVSSMGSSYAQIYERHRTGTNTWSAGQQVSAGGQVNFAQPACVTATSNRAHLMYIDASLTALTQRALNSSYTLQTVGAVGSTQFTNSGLSPRSASAVSYDDAGTQRIMYGLNGNIVGFFNSADNPTESSLTTGLSNADTFGRLFTNGADVWMLYRNSSTSDLMVARTTDEGTSWDSGATALAGTIADVVSNLSIDGNTYQRDLSIVIPYIVNDNGTLKYNEYTIATALADAWSVIDKSSNITLSNSDKTATVSSSADAGVRSTTLNSSTGGNKYYAEFVITNYVSFQLPSVGLGLSSLALSASGADTAYYDCSGNITVDGTFVGGSGLDLNDGDIVSMAWDTVNQRIWFRPGASNWNNDSGANPATNTGGLSTSAMASGNYALRAGVAGSGEAVTIRTEAAEFTQTPPVGFLSWMGETLTQPKAPTPYKQAPRFIRRMR